MTAHTSKPGWRDLEPGGLILEAGSARLYLTGGWRSQRPELNWEACDHCLLCWLFCPDHAMTVEGGRLVETDFEMCKGCGICEAVCPKEAVRMVPETLREG